MRGFPHASHAAPVRRMAVLFALALACCGPTVALSQSAGSGGGGEGWPKRPIRMVVPFVAGGAIDVVGRTIAQALGEELGTTVIVDNKAGANGIIGNDIVAKAAPDGYTILMDSGAFNGTALLYKKLPYDPIRDFAPVTQVARSYGLVLVLNNDVPAHNLKDFIALAKARPETMNFSSGGDGNITHLAGALFNHLAGTNIQHVPYKGTGPALQDVISKQITMTFTSTPLVAGPLKAKQVQALAISSPTRAPVVPGVPTFDELGLPGMNKAAGWYGLWLPAGTPQAIVDRVRGAVVAFLKKPEVRARFDDMGLVDIASTPAGFRKFLLQDMADQRELLKLGNVPQQ